IEDGEVVFDNPHFRTRAYFIETIFGKSCTFRHAEFPRADRLAVFQNTDLSNCNFLHSNIDKVDFRYCTFNDKPGKLNVLKDERDADEEVQKHPSEETLRWKMYEPVRRLYLELKRNFEDKKDWDTAGDFHYGEMECRRKMKGWFGRNLFSIEAIYFWLSGYGERPQRAAVSLGLLIGFCAIFYMYFEVLGSDFEGGYVKGFMKSGCNSLKITTLQRIGSVDEPHSLPAKVVFMFESIMGPILIALLALALRRKVKR
ncbi:MAG: pentapeptide repeat-containing protein, partial [Candidatus Thorarchaeota archaeon]